jgi:dienelactone hydrolase
MSFLKDKNKRKKFIWLTSIFTILLIIFVACAIYLGTYYHADLDAIEAFSSQHAITQRVNDNLTIFEPQSAKTGLIFYPGGKVEHSAYIPLMQECASRGILCVLVKMPFNLAVFDIKAADGIREQFPQIESWYIGGHSLGGSMAASYLEKNKDNFDGLILLGSYSTADLSSTNLKVLSIYGSEDKVLNMEKYDKNKSNLPSDYTQLIIQGGCHAYFGMYGAQKGDGNPSISNIEQIEQTALAISQLIFE